ncbi:hypothetical protein [Mucilaginibacter flavidus]|uniref:hypothetical protein n=1 Tax=Mucilaginibacter flavidus TaxID=2949309 RepID=UPI0020928C67|nr:hypothetical protein [Mucilaginibacter flavidus]MCO5946808.1 hypothetical protein [Mucilaginibacter flavidus]
MAAGNDDLFIVDSLIHTDGVIKTNLSINPGSSIFKGHFPGQPVVPGACMLQLVKDVLESALGYSVQLKKAGNLKFVGMIVPAATNAILLKIDYKLIVDEINVNAKLVDGDRVCFKFQGSFICT